MPTEVTTPTIILPRPVWEILLWWLYRQFAVQWSYETYLERRKSSPNQIKWVTVDIKNIYICHNSGHWSQTGEMSNTQSSMGNVETKKCLGIARKETLFSSWKCLYSLKLTHLCALLPYIHSSHKNCNCKSINNVEILEVILANPYSLTNFKQICFLWLHELLFYYKLSTVTLAILASCVTFVRILSIHYCFPALFS